MASLRAASEQKLKPDDEIICEFEASNRDELILFTDGGEAYKTKINDIPDCKASAMGEYLPNLLSMDPGEKIIFTVATSDFHGYMLFAFENGKIAKVEMKSFETKTNRKKLTNSYYMKVKLAQMMFIDEDKLIALNSKGGRCLIVNTSLITPKAKRDTQGVQVYLSKRDKILQSICAAEDMGFEDIKPYLSEKIPSSGRAVRDEDQPFQQMQLI